MPFLIALLLLNPSLARAEPISRSKACLPYFLKLCKKDRWKNQSPISCLSHFSSKLDDACKSALKVDVIEVEKFTSICNQEIDRYCEKVPADERLVACLFNQKNFLSKSCGDLVKHYSNAMASK